MWITSECAVAQDLFGQSPAYPPPLTICWGRFLLRRASARTPLRKGLAKTYGQAYSACLLSASQEEERMRKPVLILGIVCLCATGALAQGRVANGWACGKPAMGNSIEVGDQPNHAYSIDQIKCTSTKGEIAGVKEKEGTGTEFAEITGNSSTGHGVFVETMANGDKLDFVYQFTGTTKEGHIEAGSNKYQATNGAGKFKGIKASGTCKGTGKEDGSVDWACTGTYAIP